MRQEVFTINHEPESGVSAQAPTGRGCTSKQLLLVSTLLPLEIPTISLWLEQTGSWGS